MPEVSGIDREKIAAVMRKSRIPGVSIAYQAAGEALEATAIGRTDKHHTAPESMVKNDTVFGAASLSKPIFSYLVLKLIEKGALSRAGESSKSGLDRPLHEILSLNDFVKMHGKALSQEDMQKAQAITPRMLLSHSSGLGIDDSAKLAFEPGTQYAYSGFGLMYLQKAIESVMNKPLETLAQEEIFTPLFMTHSSFTPPEKPNYMQHTISSQLKSKRAPKMANAANSVYTTATDYAIFTRNWMQDPSPIMQEAFKPQIMLTKDQQKLPGQSEPAAKNVPENDKTHLAWGLGFGLEINDTGEAIKAFHTGDMNQFRSQVALDLTTKSSVVFFANGRDHREANGHVLGPLIIEPKISIPHAYNWFYNKFPFAKNPEELIGGPNFGLRKPELKHEWQTILINQIVNTLNRSYIDPEKLQPLKEQLVTYFEKNFQGSKYEREDGAFDKIKFAGSINKILRQYDPHIDLSFDEKGIIKQNAACIQEEGMFSWSLPATDPRSYPEELKKEHGIDLADRNSAFYDRETGVKCGEYKPHKKVRERVEREKSSIDIPESIGYIGLYSVADPSIHQVVAEQALKAMKRLEGKKAVILDLRGNTGGSPEGAKHLLSFFLEDGTHTNTVHTKQNGQWQAEEFHTKSMEALDPSGKNEAPNLRNIPLYVLVDSNTFSAGEEIAYDLQQTKRATIIGEPSVGGAHPYKVEPLIEDNSNKGNLTFNQHFTIGVPNAVAINPISGTNWEDAPGKKGVQPSAGCRVEGADALKTAVSLAKQALLKTQLQEFKSANNSNEELQQNTQVSPTPFKITPKGPGEF